MYSRIMKWAVLPVVLSAAVALSTCGRKQSTVPTVTIFNFMSYPILDASVAGIKAGLAEKGYSGSNVRIVDANANGDQSAANAMAIELLNAKPDVIVPVATPTAKAVVKEAPPGQKIVFSTVTNPADLPTDSLSNITGVADVVNYRANLALIKALFPSTKTVGIIYNPGEPNSKFGVDEVQRLAPSFGFQVILTAVSSTNEVLDATRGIMSRADVIYIGSDNLVTAAMSAVVQAALEGKKPVIASDGLSVERGALGAVSVDYTAVGKRAGYIVADILKSGRQPREIEVVPFVGNSLMLNVKTAARLGYSFPDSVVKSASQVIR